AELLRRLLNFDEVLKPVIADLHSELLQKPDVVLEVQLDVVDVVFQLRVALDAPSKGEARIFFRVVLHKSVQVRMNHPRTHHFNPAASFTHSTPGSSTKNARDIHFGAGFDEGKVTRP